MVLGAGHDGSMRPRPHVVIVGAGFGGLTAAKRLEREHVDVTLVDRHNYHSFQPLLYQVATAGLNAADVGYAVRGLFRRQQRVLFRKAQVTGVDWDGRPAAAARRAAAGLRPPDPGRRLVHQLLRRARGRAEFAFPLYGLEDAVRVRNHLLSLFEAAEAVPELRRRRRPQPGGRGRRTDRRGGGRRGGRAGRQGAAPGLPRPRRAPDPGGADRAGARTCWRPFSEHSRRYARKVLEARGVEVRLDTAVTSVAADHLTLDDGTRAAHPPGAVGGRGAGPPRWPTAWT